MPQIDTPAKLNLFFEVLGKRDDGFHEVVSVAIPIGLFDTLTFEPTDTPHIQFACVGDRGVPGDASNLVVRAVRLLQERFQVQRGAVITLTKRIPSQAGLGGGSGNAVGAMRLARQCWGLDVSDAELIPFAAELGSDCPLFFYDVPTVCTGRGDLVQPLPASPPLWFVLCKPAEGLSTAQVYAECMPLHDKQFRRPNELIAALTSGDVTAIGKCLFNRLEAPAKRIWPRFDSVREHLSSLGCLAVQMSGSGTAFFGLCADEVHSQEVLRRLVSAESASIGLISAWKLSVWPLSDCPYQTGVRSGS